MDLTRNDDHILTKKECMIDIISEWIMRVYDNVLDECKRPQDNAMIRAYNEGQRDAFIFVTDLLRMLEELDDTTSADPVIKCTDCKYYGYNECFHARGLVGASDNGFCSMAERKRRNNMINYGNDMNYFEAVKFYMEMGLSEEDACRVADQEFFQDYDADDYDDPE